MRSTNFKTENNSLRKLLGNGLFYKIPRFQRDYSWTLEQWEDLWTDILNTIEDPSQENDSHYMGYLVLQSTDDKTFEVIDGQQRLTTLTLIILAVIKICKDSLTRKLNLNRIFSVLIKLDRLTLVT